MTVSLNVARAARIGVGLAVLPATAALLLGVHVPTTELSAILQFLAAMTVLSLLDVFLPHGGSVDVDAPLIVASLYLFGPGVTVAIVLISRIVAHLFRNGIREFQVLAGGLVKRLAGIIVTTGMMGLLEALPLPAWGPYVEVTGLGIVFITVQLVVGQFDLVVQRRDSLLRTLRGNVSLQGSVLAASVSIAVLTVVIHDGMGAWGLIVTLFLVATMRQSFALLLDVRQSYHATIETLMSAMEIQSPEEKGLGERAAQLARIAGAEFGWFGRRVETMGYAALLLHYGLHFQRLDEETLEVVSTPLAAIEFLKPVEPILNLVRSETHEGARHGGDMVAAYLVARAFGHVQGYNAVAASRIRQQLNSNVRRRADKAFERALTKLPST